MGLLDKWNELQAYISANTPRNTRPRVSPAKVLDEGLLNPNKYNAPAANRFKDSAFGLLGIVPGVGDASSAAEAADLFNRGENFSGSLAALGALPLVPAIGGIIKRSGNIPKSGIDKVLGGVKRIPGLNVLPSGDRWDAAGNLHENFDINLRPLDSGDYLGQVRPPWGSKTKERYAIGDDVDELADFLLKRTAKSDKAIVAAEKSKFDKSLFGHMQREFGDVFDTAKSTQSRSEYFTHTPSGVKVRISDHDLPLHYEQPDVDLRSWMSVDEKLAAIKKAIYGE